MIQMPIRLSIGLSSLVAILLGLSAAHAQELALAPTKSDILQTDDILKTLDREHLRHLEVDDELSEDYLDQLLDYLDSMRWIFLKSDIEGFQKNRQSLDDDLLKGNLDAIFEIVNRFQERRLARWTFMRSQLETLPDVSFEQDLEFVLDRSEYPWVETKEEVDELWRRRFLNDVLNLRLADQDNEKILETLTRRYDDQIRRIQQFTSGDAYRLAMNSLTRCYDPHTEYFPPRDAENFDIQMSLSVQGIGALLTNESEYVKIERIIPGGPADKGDQLRAGDRIIGVAQGADGEWVDIIGWRTDEAVDLIRGEPGSTVRLSILPADQNDASLAKEYSLVREKVKLEEQAAQKSVIEVEEEGIKRRVGVIELPAFYVDFEGMRQGQRDFRSSTRDVYKLLIELEDENIDGLILDLRNNGGGSLTEAIQLTGLLCGSGPAVQVKDITGRVEPYGNPPGLEGYKGPIAVLVNRLSASASEILAGAVQDYGRGLVIGTQTFGKGTVQQLIPMEKGQMKLTQAKFYRVTGGSTQSKGIIPDIPLVSLYDTKEIGESSYEGALPWDRIDPAKDFSPTRSLSPLLPELRQKHKKRVTHDAEFENLKKRVDFSIQRSKRTVVSLSEANRKARREREEQELLAIENERRQALGLDEIESLDDIKDNEEKDIILDESAKILSDFIAAEKKMARRSVKR